MQKQTAIKTHIQRNPEIERIELLRARMNVLNATLFLLEENLDMKDEKTRHYLEKINKELDTIRQIIISDNEYE